MYLFYLFGSKRTAGTICRTMYNYFVNQSHLLRVVLVYKIVCVYTNTKETPRVYQALTEVPLHTIMYDAFILKVTEEGENVTGGKRCQCTD